MNLKGDNTQNHSNGTTAGSPTGCPSPARLASVKYDTSKLTEPERRHAEDGCPRCQRAIAFYRQERQKWDSLISDERALEQVAALPLDDRGAITSKTKRTDTRKPIRGDARPVHRSSLVCYPYWQRSMAAALGAVLYSRSLVSSSIRSGTGQGIIHIRSRSLSRGRPTWMRLKTPLASALRSRTDSW